MSGRRTIFDGIVRDKGVTTVIEVKFVRGGFIPNLLFRKTLARIQEAAKLLPKGQSANFRVLIAIASDEIIVMPERVVAGIERFGIEFNFPIEVRFFSLAELEREFQIGA